ncbi:MAG: MerR family transcriptional regulator [Candidatus Magasanikbacteria bacterium]|nr:MerR family transcriptional regulator [Candidatus Magasanikbacteria bacterium]
MTYTIQQLASLAGVTKRTLHHYDAIGLLEPASVQKNGYRVYGQKEVERLLQILFFRELEFSLEEIQRIISSKYYDPTQALEDQKQLLLLKQKRIKTLIHTIDTRIKHMNNDTTQKQDEVFDSFDTSEFDAYKEEAKQRWGHTEAWKQSQERTKHWTKKEYARVKEEGEVLMRQIVAVMDKGAADPEVQALIHVHYNSLREFYDPNISMYRGLGQMYVDDPRFTAYFEKFAQGLAVFMKDAIFVYCDLHD